MSPLLPDMVIDTRSLSHSSLVCIIRQTDIAAAAPAVAAAVAVAVGSLSLSLSPKQFKAVGGRRGGGSYPPHSPAAAIFLVIGPPMHPAPPTQWPPIHSPVQLSHKASAVFRRDAPRLPCRPCRSGDLAGRPCIPVWH